MLFEVGKTYRFDDKPVKFIRSVGEQAVVSSMDGKENKIIFLKDLEPVFCKICGRDSEQNFCRKCLVREMNFLEKNEWNKGGVRQ